MGITSTVDSGQLQRDCVLVYITALLPQICRDKVQITSEVRDALAGRLSAESKRCLKTDEHVIVW